VPCCATATTPTVLARRTRLSLTILTALARRRQPARASRAQAVRHAEIARLARALRDAARQRKANHAQLATIVDDLAPGLTSRRGIGPVSAAQAIVSITHPGRGRHDAAFARLGGASPLPASSGQTTRHRLNHGGDRALNMALHVIATSPMHCDPATIAYVTRRRAEGKPIREIRRCLKRYIARQLYRALTAAMAPHITGQPHGLTNIEASSGRPSCDRRPRARTPATLAPIFTKRIDPQLGQAYW
jgi:transposase